MALRGDRWTVLLPGAAAACLLGVLTWQVIAGGPLTGRDVPVHDWVWQHQGTRTSPFWAVLGELGDGRLTFPALAAAGAAVWWRRRAAGTLIALRPLITVAAALALFAAALEIMKTAIGRASPNTGSDAALAGGTAFPSGHTSSATVIWGLMAFLVVCLAGPRWRRYRARACLAAGAVAGVCAGLGMVLMDYHWLTDVAGGWLLGMLVLDLVIVAPGVSFRGARDVARAPVTHVPREKQRELTRRREP